MIWASQLFKVTFRLEEEIKCIPYSSFRANHFYAFYCVTKKFQPQSPLSFNPLSVHTETKLTTAQQLFALTRLILLLLPVCNIRCCYYIWLSPVHGPRQQLRTLQWQSSLLCFSLFNFLILFSFLSVTLFFIVLYRFLFLSSRSYLTDCFVDVTVTLYRKFGVGRNRADRKHMFGLTIKPTLTWIVNNNKIETKNLCFAKIAYLGGRWQMYGCCINK